MSIFLDNAPPVPFGVDQKIPRYPVGDVSFSFFQGGRQFTFPTRLREINLCLSHGHRALRLADTLLKVTTT